MKKFGEILIAAGRISQKNLNYALERQGKEGERIGTVLLKEGWISEIDLVDTLGKQFNLTVKHTLPGNPNVEFARLVSIGFLKQFRLVPVSFEDEQYIAADSPFEFEAYDNLRKILNWPLAPLVLAPVQQINNVINFAYDMTQASASEVLQDIHEDDPEKLFSEIEEVGDLLDETSDSPVIRLVNLVFSQAVRDNASDIHIEPYQNSLKIRQRLDGILYDMLSPPKHVQSSLISRIKIMARLDIAEKRLPQDGRIELKIADKEIDVRVSTLPTAFGERVVMRLLNKSSVMISLTELGMSAERLDVFEKEIRAPNGIVLVTGPTGSGKTTTLYAALSAINSTDINIITVEDPIEYRISGIGQVQVNPKIDLTFASGLRSIVRQDPDVIFVGEIRDSETAEIAIQSALTGHLVFSTLHTNDSAGAVTRLRDMGVEPFLIASSVNAVVAQRLVRVICPHCREEYRAEEMMLKRMGLLDALSGKTLFRGRGCVHCHHTGYKGRCGLYEVLQMTSEMKSLVLRTSDANELKNKAVESGMVTLQRDGVDKITKGITTLEELYRVISSIGKG